jgi:hypothetical protein
MSGAEWMIAMTFGAAGISWLAYWLNRDGRIRRKVARLPLTSMPEVIDGRRVKVAGTVELRHPPLTAPLSGRPCAAWSVVLQEPDEGGWRTLAQEWKAVEFVIVDDSGMSARVTEGRVEVVYELDVEVTSGWSQPPTLRLREILKRHGQELESFFGAPKPYRAREGIIEHGERVTVVGVAQREPDPLPRAVGAVYRETPQRLVLRADEEEPLYIIDAPARRPLD